MTEVLNAIGLPGTRLHQRIRKWRIREWQPAERTAKELGYHCELESIDAISLQQICGELSATQKHEPLNANRTQRLEPLRPGWRQREPTIKTLMHGCRSQ